MVILTTLYVYLTRFVLAKYKFHRLSLQSKCSLLSPMWKVLAAAFTFLLSAAVFVISNQ